MSSEKNEIQLKLNDVTDLFAEPEADPFDANSRYLSGIDEVVGQMRLKRRDLANATTLIIRLPETAVTPDTQATVKAALARYSAAKIAENEQVIEELRVGSRRETISAIVIVAFLLLLTFILIAAIPGLETVSGAIAGFIGIAIWVIFWDPIYNYVYAWRPNQLDKRVFENLLQAEVVIEGVGEQ